MAVAFIAAGLLALHSATAWADTFRKEISKGNEAYKEKNYERAAGHYRSAEIDRPGSPVAAYNLGTALVGGKNYEEALRKLAEASEKLAGLEKSSAYYNIGNGLFGAEKYREAAGAYKKTLEINPADRDAKYNLELALRKLKEQQQKKNQRQDKNDQNQKDPKGSSSDSDSTKQDQKQEQQKNQPAKSDEKKGQEKPKPSQPKQQMTKEEAERILAALKNEEMKAKKEKKTQGIPLQGGRDW